MSNDLPARPAGAETFRQATDAASLCREIVRRRAVSLHGRRYVPVEGWQAIAIAHGCVLSSEDVRVHEDGVSAVGVVRRIADGVEIARAEGFVGRDEPAWFGGQGPRGPLPKRPDYAIRAMAQTRAMSRAGRAAFAHVVVMMDIGLETVPAEEVLPDDAGAPRLPQPAAGRRGPGRRGERPEPPQQPALAERLAAFEAACAAAADPEALARLEARSQALWADLADDQALADRYQDAIAAARGRLAAQGRPQQQETADETAAG